MTTVDLLAFGTPVRVLLPVCERQARGEAQPVEVLQDQAELPSDVACSTGLMP